MKPDPERLRELMTPEWTREREDAGLRRLEGDVPSRPVLRFVVPLVAAAAVVGAFFIGRVSNPPSADEDPTTVAGAAESIPSPASPDRQASVPPSPPEAPTIVPLRFRDGTLVMPHDADSNVVIADASDQNVRVQLRRGGARFDVTPDRERRFAVESGPVTVEVLGTEFDCEREGDRVTVEVIRGRVAVNWKDGSEILTAGESGTFPPVVEPPAQPTTPRPRDWRRIAKRGDVDKAYDALEAGAKVANRAEELMLAADVARRAGHATAALPYLRRVLDNHRKDSRAPLAAFTIGRIELNRGKYTAAARSFTEVGKLGGSSLAEHALAREVEAWVGAKKMGKARRRAEEYVKRYPDGPRVEQVRRMAGIGGG